jgi:hypothetical protein
MKKIATKKQNYQKSKLNEINNFISSSDISLNFSKPQTPSLYSYSEIFDSPSYNLSYKTLNNQSNQNNISIKRFQTPNLNNRTTNGDSLQIMYPLQIKQDSNNEYLFNTYENNFYNNKNGNILSHINLNQRNTDYQKQSDNHISKISLYPKIYPENYDFFQSNEIILNNGNIINNNFEGYNIASEPSENLNISEFELLEEIGKGTYGKIYRAKWKLNNKFYALKEEILKDINGVKKRQNIFKIIRDFIQKTNCKEVVNIYSNSYIQKGLKFNYYELMEMCDKDFEKEIKTRSQYYLFYTESELQSIMLQLITALAFLQKNHITHRDIKPQNILVVNGQYKLCDFGEIRVMQREGIVVQRVRGSELYMSPILFYGLRSKKVQVRHNTYKSDVFSLGMCLFFAAGLSYRGPVEIREVSDMKKKEEILNRRLSSRYSKKLINILHLMLQTKEVDRPDFILLEEAIKKYGL